MRKFRTEDGYTFFEQENGVLTDTLDADNADLMYESIEQLRASIDADEIPVNVFEYLTFKLHTVADDQGMATEFPLDSVCGEACKLIIDRTVELLAVCDAHPNVRGPIVSGAITACEIVCFG